MFKQLRIYFNNKHRARITGLLCFVALYISAQTAISNKSPQLSKKKVQLIQSVSLDKRTGSDLQILIDSVILFHDGAFMYCDSAYLDDKSNSFEAFSNIRVNQGDTLFLYGDYLRYDGNTKLLQVRENVRLENRDVTLFTDSLDYDRILNMGYYFDGGMLVDSLNELTSYWGQYEPNIRIATFSDSVKLVNERFTLYSDTLKYSTETRIARILGPSVIVSDSGTIHSTRGWYNTLTEESMLFDRSKVISKNGSRILIGDSIAYNKQKGYGEVFGNMFLQDTLKKIILCGHYGYYNEISQYAMATDSAWATEYSQADTLYLHADTLKMVTVDSIYRELKAYHGARFYRTDVQGVADSMQFNTKDSVLYLYKDPVLWNEGQQLYGDTIEIFMNDSTVDWIHMKQYAFAIEQKDSIHFNQVKGRDLKAYFIDGEIRHVIIEGNAESLYYTEEKDGTMIGLNKTESGYLSMDMKNRKIEKLKLWPKANGIMTPLPDLTTEQLRFSDFQWFDYLRPLNKGDIFRKVKKKEEAVRKTSNKFIEEEN